MIRTLSAFVKRLNIGRNLVRLLFALLLLFAGFILRSFVPIGWFQIGSMTLPEKRDQAPMSGTSQRNQASVDADMNGTGESGTLIRSSMTPTPTPTPTNSIVANPGIVTVITLTPTGIIPATDMKTTSTLPAISEQGPTLSPAQSPTPTRSDSGESTRLPLLTTTEFSFLPESSPAISEIQMDMVDLYRIVKVTGTMLQTYNQGQLVNEELEALQAQVIVVAQRTEKLEVKLEAAQANLETFGPSARISPGQVRDIFDLIRQFVKIEQLTLSDPEADSTTLAQAQTMFEKLQRVLEQVQSLIATTQDANSFVSAPATLTMTPVPTPFLAQTVSPTPVTMLNDQMSQLQTMLLQMEEMLQQIQSMLDQIQIQPGIGTIP